MKVIFLFVLTFLVFMRGECVYAQYTARVEVVQEWLVADTGHHELNVKMRADLYYNGVLVPPEPDFQYQWWRKTKRLDAVFEPFGSCAFDYACTHTVIDDPNSEFYIMWYTCVINGSLRSDTIAIPMWRTIVDQETHGGSSYGSVRYWKESQFTLHHAVPDTFYTPQANETIVLQADTNLNPSRTEKYHHWLDGTWVNHAEFGTGQLFTSYTSQFQAPVGACTIRTHLIDAPNLHGSIQFKDPWFRDTADQYGVFNRGLAATLRTGTSPLTPNTNASGAGSEYHGVFLNQQFSSGTYYSVGAPNPNTINGFSSYFVNWSGTNVQYQDANAAQTGVVFTNSGATATAKYKAHLGSSSGSSTGTNSQRKMVSDGNGSYYLTYTSANEVWFTHSSDVGSTWSAEVLLSDNTGHSSAPSIALGDDNEAYVVFRKRTSSQYDIQLPLV